MRPDYKQDIPWGRLDSHKAVPDSKAKVNITELQELVWGGSSSSGAAVLELINGNASSINICTPVYVTDAGSTVDLAQADLITTARSVGLVKQLIILPGEIGQIQTTGLLEATTGEWDTVTGDVGGLIPNMLYYIKVNVAGKLTRLCPQNYTDFLCRVGQAISTTEMVIKIEFLGRR